MVISRQIMMITGSVMSACVTGTKGCGNQARHPNACLNRTGERLRHSHSASLALPPGFPTAVSNAKCQGAHLGERVRRLGCQQHQRCRHHDLIRNRVQEGAKHCCDLELAREEAVLRTKEQMSWVAFTISVTVVYGYSDYRALSLLACQQNAAASSPGQQTREEQHYNSSRSIMTFAAHQPVCDGRCDEDDGRCKVGLRVPLGVPQPHENGHKHQPRKCEHIRDGQQWLRWRPLPCCFCCLVAIALAAPVDWRVKTLLQAARWQ